MNTAQAEPTATLGAGSGIIVSEKKICSLTAVGYDKFTNLIGLTAGHCGNVGDSISAEESYRLGAVGTIVRVNADLDYAVITLDTTKVTPLASVGGLTFSGLGPDPQQGNLACKNGRTTGVDCGIVWGPADVSPHSFYNQTCSRPGDSGGPVVVNGRLIGMNNGNVGTYNIGGIVGLNFDLTCTTPFFAIHNPALTTSITAILNDINSSSGAGIGFTPLVG
ncbi:MAG: serine protease [Mycobacteriaceae bacterium]